jgi:hypothetical protein
VTEQSLLQAAVRMICGCLADLSAADQARALEQACVALGLRVFVAQPDPGTFGTFGLVPATPLLSDPVPPYQEPLPYEPPAFVARAPLPMVQIEMRGDRPMVVGNRSVARRPPRPSTLVMDTQGRLPLLATRDLSASSDAAEPTEQARPRGYVCRIR